MVANQKKYTDEFRRKTADYVISTGCPITQVCGELGLNPKTVNDWVLKRKRELGGGEPDPRAEERELREARKRIRELEAENAFLKKPRPSSPKSRHSSQVQAHGGGEGQLHGGDDGQGAGGGEPVGPLQLGFQRLPRRRLVRGARRRAARVARVRQALRRAVREVLPARRPARHHAVPCAQVHARAGDPRHARRTSRRGRRSPTGTPSQGPT